MPGITLEARSGTSKQSIAAIKAMRPATRAWTNGSFNARENAGTRTFCLVLCPNDGARRPRRMQVFVRIEGSTSIWVLAKRRRRSLLRIRSVNYMTGQRRNLSFINNQTFGANKIMDLTVASRIGATVSENPSCCRRSQCTVKCQRKG